MILIGYYLRLSIGNCPSWSLQIYSVDMISNEHQEPQNLPQDKYKVHGVSNEAVTVPQAKSAHCMYIAPATLQGDEIGCHLLVLPIRTATVALVSSYYSECCYSARTEHIPCFTPRRHGLR
jgi:hypothetical protein